MEDLRQFFSSESIEKLKNLNTRLQNADAFSDSEKREVFRTLHTLKGSSQTFGFNSASKLAHKLETILSTVQSPKDFNQIIRNVFAEGFELMISSLEKKHFEIPASFVEKINLIVPEAAGKNDFLETYSPEIPLEISVQLAGQEKDALLSAWKEGKTLYVLEIGFEAAKFAVEFKNFRQILSDSGEIVAALPSRKFNNQGKIGFQIVFASFLKTAQVKRIAEKSSAEIIFDASETSFSNDLQGVLSQAVEHGKAIAKNFGKTVEFVISADEAKLSNKQLKLVFDALTHLIRNAVDHAVEVEGKIEIMIRSEEKTLKLIVSDNGRGIDSEKIKAKAVEKNLISDGKNLSEQETLGLIFLPEFSTASRLTEISGRGIGLDAVKVAVEAAGGRINVERQKVQGETFEISLPTDEK